MELNNRDKIFLMKAMKNVRRIMKMFKHTLTEQEIELIEGLEPAIKDNKLNVFQIEFLIKNMENVYKTTPNKYTKQLIANLHALKEHKEQSEGAVIAEPVAKDEPTDEPEYRLNEEVLK